MPRALLLTVATLLIGLAFAIGSAEASGDEFGDSFDSTGGIVGDLNDVLGPSDGVIVHIGADETGDIEVHGQDAKKTPSLDDPAAAEG